MRAAHIKHNEGKFDLKNCTASKTLNFSGKLECVINKQINIFDYEATVTNSTQGTLQRELYTNSELVYVGEYNLETVNIYDLDTVLNILGEYPDKSANGYYIEYIEVAVFPEFNYEEKFIAGLGNIEVAVYVGHRFNLYVQYTRFYSPISLGNNWVELAGGGYYLSYNITNDWGAPEIFKITERDPFGISKDYGSVAYLKGRYSVFSNTKISNTVAINQILTDIFSCTGYMLKSNFFGISPDNTAPQSPEYDFALNYCQNIKICQSYDIIRESAIQDSFGVSGLINTKDFITDICNLFNLVINVEYDTGIIRLENASYYSNKGPDLTLKDYEISQLDLNREFVDSENFTMARITPSEGFYQVNIKYNSPDIYREPNEKKYTTKLIITDLTGTINNREYEKDEYKSLFYLLSTDGNSVISLNTAFSMYSLFTNLHQNNRPQKNGYVNGVLSNFGSYSIGVKGEIKFNSTILSWDKLSPLMSVKTDYGVFLINSVSIDDKGLITLNISK